MQKNKLATFFCNHFPHNSTTTPHHATQHQPRHTTRQLTMAAVCRRYTFCDQPTTKERQLRSWAQAVSTNWRAGGTHVAPHHDMTSHHMTTPLRYTRTYGTHSIYTHHTTDRRCAPQSAVIYTRAPQGSTTLFAMPHITRRNTLSRIISPLFARPHYTHANPPWRQCAEGTRFSPNPRLRSDSDGRGSIGE